MLTNNIALCTKYESWLQNCNFLISIVPLDDTCAWMIGRTLAALTKAFEMEDNDLLNMEGIETNRNLLTSFVSGVADFFLFLFPKK